MAVNVENGGAQRGSGDALKKLRRHSLLSVITFLIGVALVVIIGIVEDDPTIPPLVMIVFGIGWFFVTRARIRSHRE